MEFAHRHPSLIGAVIGLAIIASSFRIAKLPDMPREARLPWLLDTAGFLYLFTLVPVLATQTKGGHVTRWGHHFEYLALITAMGMLGLSAILFGVWWVLASMLVHREVSSTARD